MLGVIFCEWPKLVHGEHVYCVWAPPLQLKSGYFKDDFNFVRILTDSISIRVSNVINR